MLAGFLRKLIGHQEQRDSVPPAIEEMLEQARSALANGNPELAEDSIDRALRTAPSSVKVLHLGGAIAAERKDFEISRKRFMEAIRIAPQDSGLRSDFGQALLMLGQLHDAELEFRLALKFDRDNAVALRNLVEVLLREKRFEEGLEFAQQLALREPDNPRAIYALGFAMTKRLRFREAYAILKQAKAAGEDSAAFFHCLAGCAMFLRSPKEAEDILREGLNKHPHDQDCEYLLSHVLMAQGRWREAGALHESRYSFVKVQDAESGTIRWNALLDRVNELLPSASPGQISGQRVLVVYEQGFGDVIMMMRLFPVLFERGAVTVSLLCPAGPVFDLREAIPGVSFIEARDDLNLSEWAFTVRSAAMSLPYLLEVDGEPFPGKAPFLFPPQERVGHWYRWLKQQNERSAKLMVGLAWAGNPKLSLDALRSIPLKFLQPLFAVQGVAFVNLQKDHDTREEMQLSEFEIIDPMHEVNGFLDTAAIIQNLDLVVSVDTVIAHLAGALAKPVWMLNRYESEWRWQFDREESPWYPSMRIFNQREPRNWQTVVADVAENLQKLVRNG